MSPSMALDRLRLENADLRSRERIAKDANDAMAAQLAVAQSQNRDLAALLDAANARADKKLRNLRGGKE